MNWVVGVAYKKQFEIFIFQFYKSFKAETVESSYKDNDIEYEPYI